jgi:prepilin-type N-terminal cleavage/methylation domain-containing protein
MKNKGFTLLEVIIAITILTTAIGGSFALIQQNLVSASMNQMTLTGYYLAQEGLEIVKNIRDNNWLAEGWNEGLEEGIWQVDYNSTIPVAYQNQYLKIDSNGFYGYSSGSPTNFKRKITIGNIMSEETVMGLEVTALVEWEERGRTHKAEVTEYLYNWYGYEGEVAPDVCLGMLNGIQVEGCDGPCQACQNEVCAYYTSGPGFCPPGYECDISGQCVDGGDPVRTFPDNALEAAVRTAVGVPEGDIHQSDLDAVSTFDASCLGIADLTGMEYWTNLTSLQISGCGSGPITDLSPLASLTGLTTLILDGNSIEDISSLASLTSLMDLELNENSIVNIPDLSGLTSLTYLDLDTNSIVDCTSLASLTSLTTLYITNNSLSEDSYDILYDLEALGSVCTYDPDPDPPLNSSFNDANLIATIQGTVGKTWFRQLDLDLIDIFGPGGVDITDLTGMELWTSLTYVDLNGNSIEDVSPLASLTNLTQLFLSVNSIVDISPLASLTNLTILDITSNPLNAAAYSTDIPALEAAGVTVYYDSQPDVCSGVPNNTQVEGCDGSCQACQNDVCDFVDSGTDPYSNCSGEYSCSGFTTRLRNMCDGSGSCADIDAAASDCSGTCASYCSAGSCVNANTGAGTCIASTNARVSSGGDGYCSSGSCINGWVSGYFHRKQITINGSTDSAQTNYQMKLTVYKGTGTDSSGATYLNNKALSWPNDIRFTKSDGITELDYWVESTTAASSTVWVEFDNIPKSPGTAAFYMYWGKTGDAGNSNALTTFREASAIAATPSYTVSSNRTPSPGWLGTEPWKGMDDIITVDVAGSFGINSDVPSYLLIDLGLAPYIYQARASGITYSGGQLQVSNDGTNFTTFQTWASSATLYSGIWSNYADVKGSYRYLRINKPNSLGWHYYSGFQVIGSKITVNPPTWGTWGSEE